MNGFLDEYGSLIAEAVSASAVIALMAGPLYMVVCEWVAGFVTEVI